MVSAELVAGLSSDFGILIAAMMLPSSIFEETAAAKTLAVSALRCFLRTRGSGASSSHLHSSLPSRFLMMAVRLYRFPPRRGGWR